MKAASAYLGIVEVDEGVKFHGEIGDLEDLLFVMRHNYQWINGKTWDDLPTFGGRTPRDTSGVWSWDKKRKIIGTCARDVQIVPRKF